MSVLVESAAVVAVLVKKSIQAAAAASSGVAMACHPQAVLKSTASLVLCLLPVGPRHAKVLMLSDFSI